MTQRRRITYNNVRDIAARNWRYVIPRKANPMKRGRNERVLRVPWGRDLFGFTVRFICGAVVGLFSGWWWIMMEMEEWIEGDWGWLYACFVSAGIVGLATALAHRPARLWE